MDDLDINPDENAEKATPSDADRRAAELEARNRLLEQEAKRSNEAFMQMAQATLASRNQPAPPEEEEIEVPDAEDDPDGHLNAVVARKLKEALKPVGEAISGYQQNDRTLLLQTRIDMEKRDMRERYGSEWSSMEKDVEKYLSSYPLEQQAAPGALQEAFNRVYGQKALTRQIEETKRVQSSIGSGGHTPGSSDSPDPSRVRDLSEVEARWAARGKLDARSFRALQGPGRMSIDDYVSTKTPAKGAK